MRIFIYLIIFPCLVKASDLCLKHLILTDNLSSVQNVSFKEKVVFHNLMIPKEAELKDQLFSVMNTTLHQDSLENIKKMILFHYQKEGYSLVKVMIPAQQDIAGGTLIILVIVARVGTVTSQGAKYFSNTSIRKQLRFKEGQFIQTRKLTEDINWINNNSFRNTAVVLEPGENFGETNIALNTKDRFPLKVYGGYENNGYQVGGNSRFLSGLNWGNAFGLSHQLNTLFITALDLDKWWAISSNYIAPTSFRHIIDVSGFFSRSSPDMGVKFNLIGKSWKVQGKYKVPFESSAFKHVIYFGYDFKKTNNFLTYSDELVFNRFIDISQFSIGSENTALYSRGTTTIRLVLFFSPGNMTALNTDANFEQERSGAKANYLYGKIYLEQMIYLPLKSYWYFEVAYQLASGKLLPSEEFSIGGYQTVRGYDENQAFGDNGLLCRNELRSMLIDLPPKKKRHQLQFLGFIDFGIVYDADQRIFTSNTKLLASIGPGVRYYFENNIQFRFDYGWQLKTSRRVDEVDPHHSRLHTSLIISF